MKHLEEMEETRKKNEENLNLLKEELEKIKNEASNLRSENLNFSGDNFSSGMNQINSNNLIETKIDISKLKEDDKACSICLEDFENNDKAIFLPCFHVFHSKCINDWLSKKDECPLCKISIKNNLNNNEF